MEYSEIKKLIDDMGNSKLDSIDIEFPDGVKIKMKKDTRKEVIESKNQDNQDNKNKPREDKETENYKVIKSPMVGTFYASPAPSEEPFVKLGDKVHKGQVLCVVEAMKLMNEIESEYDGEIVEICIKNEDMVEYGTPLFKIKD